MKVFGDLVLSPDAVTAVAIHGAPGREGVIYFEDGSHIRAKAEDTRLLITWFAERIPTPPTAV